MINRIFRVEYIRNTNTERRVCDTDGGPGDRTRTRISWIGSARAFCIEHYVINRINTDLQLAE